MYLIWSSNIVFKYRSIFLLFLFLFIQSIVFLPFLIPIVCLCGDWGDIYLFVHILTHKLQIKYFFFFSFIIFKFLLDIFL